MLYPTACSIDRILVFKPRRRCAVVNCTFCNLGHSVTTGRPGMAFRKDERPCQPTLWAESVGIHLPQLFPAFAAFRTILLENNRSGNGRAGQRDAGFMHWLAKQTTRRAKPPTKHTINGTGSVQLHVNGPNHLHSQNPHPKARAFSAHW